MADALEPTCRALAALSSSWSWDGRFAAVVAAFESGQAAAVEAAVGGQLGTRWTSASLASAPTRVRGLVGKLGGLRPDQQLFTHATEGGAMLWCAWWPWQSGTRFSLRIGVDGTDVDPRPWFGA